jgi:protein arginine kinase
VSTDELVRELATWLDASGPKGEIVVSSRARLARNLADTPFPHRGDSLQASRVFDRAAQAASSCQALTAPSVFDFDELVGSDRRILVERHLASARLERGTGRRGVVVASGEGSAVLINEEDHVRIQSVVSGLDLGSALNQAVQIDREMEERLAFAANDRHGYLTACPTNAGTGLRASVLIHLAGLVLVGEVKKVRRAVAEMGMAVRGWYGEGSRALGDFYQLSNQRTLGISEEECVDELEKVAERVLELELDARERLRSSLPARRRMEDRISRSWATLRAARLLTDDQVMACVSDARLGSWLGILEQVPPRELNGLALFTQPAHLSKRHGRAVEGDEADWIRARIVRETLSGYPEPREPENGTGV